jgi:hypothetical protein
MMVVVKRTEAFVALHPESKSLRAPLDRKVAKLLQLKLIHSLEI